jgi:hypothetical protein
MKWIAGVSLVAAVVFVAAAVTIPAQTVEPDQAILKLFPAETRGIAFADAAALRNTPLGQEVIAEANFVPRTPKLADFITQTGFNFRDDIDRLTIGRLENRRMLFAIEARYDKFKVERYLADHVTRLETHMGRTIYEDRDHNFGVTFIDSLIIAGYTDAVKKAVEQASLPASSVSINPDLIAAIRSFDAGSQVWGAGEFHFEELPVAQLPPQGVNAGPVLEILKTLQGGTYRMRVDTDVHARATANFTTADSAKGLAALGQGMIALMKLRMAEKNPDVLRALDGIQISNSGTQMIVDIEQPGELVKKLRLGRGLRRLRG